MKKCFENIICKDRDSKRYKVLSNQLKFRPAVYGILIKNDKILLSNQFGNGYDFPGGGIEIYETIEEALKREFFEETCLRVKIGKLVSCESSFFMPKFHKSPFNAISIYYLVKKVGGKITDKYFDIYEKKYMEKPEWISLSDVKKIKFYNSVDSLDIICKAIGK